MNTKTKSGQRASRQINNNEEENRELLFNVCFFTELSHRLLKFRLSEQNLIAQRDRLKSQKGMTAETYLC